MTVESTNDSEVLLNYLGNRIEEIERSLYDDEDFCNRDIDATYERAVQYIRSLEEKFHAKLKELKNKLEQIRYDNISVSKDNRKQFDDEIDDVNQLFSSGKHQEAVDKFEDYEKRFQQRITLIRTVPKLYMNDMDINRYFSFDKPINVLNDIPQEPIEPTKLTTTKKENDDLHEQEYQRPYYDVRYKRADNQPISTTNPSMSKATKSPVPTVLPRPLRFSTRLSSSPSSRDLPMGERDLATPSSGDSDTKVRATSASPNVILEPIRHSISTAKYGKIEGLTSISVTHYQHDQNTSLLMACNKDYIILFRSKSDRSVRWHFSAIVRFNKKEQDLEWDDRLIISIGSIDKMNLYIFTEHTFIIYSLDSFSTIASWTLSSTSDRSDLDAIKCRLGAVYDRYIYYISLNTKSHWILELFELQTMTHLVDYNLTEIFPDVRRFLHICINDETIGFLVEMNSSYYAVIFCPNNNRLTTESKTIIQLSYAEHPLTICSVYIHCLQRYLFFINDPSAKIIHLLTKEKYLQSYSITAYTLSYVGENHELIFTSNNGIYAIRLNDQESFFSKFR